MIGFLPSAGVLWIGQVSETVIFCKLKNEGHLRFHEMNQRQYLSIGKLLFVPDFPSHNFSFLQNLCRRHRLAHDASVARIIAVSSATAAC